MATSESGPMKPTFPGRSGNDFQDMCTMIGLMTLTWGWCDTTLAMTIGMIIENFGSVDGHSQAPASMKKKRHCLRRALRSIDVLKPLQERGMALSERFVDIGTRRNDIVHSAASQGHEGSFEAVGLKALGEKYVRQTHRFTLDDILRMNVEIGTLSDDVTAFMLDVRLLILGDTGVSHA